MSNIQERKYESEEVKKRKSWRTEETLPAVHTHKHTHTHTHTHNLYATHPLKSGDNDLQISPKRTLHPAASSHFTPPSLLVSPTCLSLIAPVFHHSLSSVAETYQRLNQWRDVWGCLCVSLGGVHVWIFEIWVREMCACVCVCARCEERNLCTCVFLPHYGEILWFNVLCLALISVLHVSKNVKKKKNTFTSVYVCVYVC